ncbi:ribonuclease H-like domain-containing protein [Tanacetum coccineum]
MWTIRIEQYFQVQDYALWEVIENDNSFKPIARTTANADGTSTSIIPGPITTEEKAQKKNDVKARSMLLMAIPNEHLLTFNQYKDAKTLFAAIHARFGGNDATKKTQKTLLNQLAILGESISPKDLNLKFLRSLPAEWNTHVVVWRNKPDLDTMSFDDLYNNFKIVEQEVKRTITSSSSSSSQNMAFVSSPSSTNDVNTANVQVSAASTPVSTVSTTNNTANLSDATVYAFLANQPNGSQLAHEDLEQIHEDDLEEMDLKWQLALLKCFNCHKMGHFARECRSLRNQDNGPRNQDSSRKILNVEETSSKAMVPIDGAGFDWSLIGDEEIPTNMSLMGFSDSEVHNDKTCSNTSLKIYETIKTQYDNLRIELNKFEFDLATYKRGLASMEEQLVFYKKNEVMLCDQIAVLKRDHSFKDLEINALNIQIEKLKKEKESNQIKIDNFENASKSLNKLIGSQISENSRKGVGFTNYNAVAPPPTGLFAPPTVELSNSGLEEFQQPEFEGYRVKVNKSVCEVKKTPDAPIIEDWVSDCDEDESEVRVLKSDNVQQKPKQANQPRKGSENPRNIRTNWNEMKTWKLEVGFQFTYKACFVCGNFSHLIKDCDFHDKRMVQKYVMDNVKRGTGQREVRPVWNNAMRVNHQNFSNSRRNFALTAVLTKSGLVSFSVAKQTTSNAAAPVSAARPVNTVVPEPFVNVAKLRPNTFQKSHSLSKRPFHQTTTLKNRNLKEKVNTVKGDLQDALKDTCIFDSGCSRHMTRNKSYLTDYQDYDGGFVAFAGSSKGGRITSKGKIRIGKLDFEDVKNNVLFTETECLILSLDFKRPDETQVLFKVPKKNNMYSFDLKNIVPLKVRGLPSKIFENDHTCVACQKGKQHKASLVIDDYRRFSWVFFLAKKDETSGILKDFITGIENQLNHKVKIIRCDNRTEFKNYEMNQFCGIKGIEIEFSNARTPQQNEVAKRKNKTLIEAARTMLADIPFWAEAVNTACYVHNRVLVTKPHNKTPYELLIGRTCIISFIRPFGCPVTILNTLDHLGKFDGKADEGFLVGCFINTKAFRVFNNRTRKVEENLHVKFLENKPNVAGIGPEWLFDIDSLTNSMNYQSVRQVGKERVPDQEYILFPLLNTSSYFPLSSEEAESTPKDDAGKKTTD